MAVILSLNRIDLIFLIANVNTLKLEYSTCPAKLCLSLLMIDAGNREINQAAR